MCAACHTVSISGRLRDRVNQGAAEKLTYAQFQLDTFAANQPPVGSTAEEDFDGDGINNYTETWIPLLVPCLRGRFLV